MSTPECFDDVDRRSVDTLRMLALDMVETAASGHPGMPLGAAPMAYVLWSRHLRFDPANPDWPDRDRFVLSAGHGSALLYALLHLCGFDLPLEELRRFRQWGSRTPGHPERGVTPGVEVTTGPLGQGFANAVGLAVGEAHLAARFNRPGLPLVDHHTYTICSDGDLMEGVAHEAASLAGHLGLGKLIALYDSNRVSLAADTRLCFSEDVAGRFRSCGWQVLEVTDGNDLDAIDRALRQARAQTGRPSLIRVSTAIGYGSPGFQGRFEAHGAPFGAEEVRATKENLGWPVESAYHRPEAVLERFSEVAAEGRRCEGRWRELATACAERFPQQKQAWDRLLRGDLPADWDRDLPGFEAGAKIATRAAGGKILNALGGSVDNLIGGSADLDPSTKTTLEKRGSFQAPGSGDDSIPGSPGGTWDYRGANIAFGVREHAMGGILNGLAAHGGLRPYGSTFLVFSDYLRPALRLAALSRLAVIYVFTHDSVAVGEDGPTHQPVEHLASLRAIPNLAVLRPADAGEVAVAWRVALERCDGPTALIMSRQKLPVLDRRVLAPAAGLARGAYVLAEPPGAQPPELLLIATGAEVHPALAAADELNRGGRRVRVVSMPSWELFAQQPQAYRHQVLPPDVTARVSVEAGATQGWHRFVGERGLALGLDRFGASAPGEEVLERFGFSAVRVLARIREYLEGL